MIRLKNSLKGKLFKTFVISMVLTICSFGFSVINTLKLQKIADGRFKDEVYFMELQAILVNMQNPLQSYLSAFSTSALSELLNTLEVLQHKIPDNRPVYQDELELLKREVYFLIENYTEDLHSIIDLKRGRKVKEYTTAYTNITIQFKYILKRIDDLSLKGLRNQLVEYNTFLILFKKLQMYSLILILTVVTIAFVMLLKSANSISQPMFELSKMATKLSNGNFNIDDINLNSVREINRVARAFNDMKYNIKHNIDEIKRQKEFEQQAMIERVRNLKMEQVLKRMELYTMQAQMNPHFLFNTINTGVQLAIVEEAERTADFMENLADLLRYNIREKRFFVPLRKEIEGLVSYINILKIRFPHKLNITIDVDTTILDDVQCPAMVLQPIVENAVIHAFKDKEDIGTIIINVTFTHNLLKLSVKDNGKGIIQKTIDELLIPHTHDYKLSSKVMGLENVIQRCYFFYPNNKKVVEIKSEINYGTEIIISIDTEVEPCIEF